MAKPWTIWRIQKDAPKAKFISVHKLRKPSGFCTGKSSYWLDSNICQHTRLTQDLTNKKTDECINKLNVLVYNVIARITRQRFGF